MIEMLPDDVLLEIFDAYRILHLLPKFYHHCNKWDWDRLVHVCRRWRQLIFASPLRLSVQLHCTQGIDVKKFLGCWPAFPITLDYYTHYRGIGPEEHNIPAALEHSDRVHHLCLHITDKRLAMLATAMQKPFPMLTELKLSRDNRPKPVLPPGLLGEAAPRLQELDLEGILFTKLPNFLSSTRNLVTLILSGIRLKFIPPETMVTHLAPLTRLSYLSIGDHIFDPYKSTFPSEKLDPTRTRIVLPALTSINFESSIHYIEDFVARIDCPRLTNLNLCPRNSPDDIDLRLSQVYKLLDRSDHLLTLFDSVYTNISFEKITLRVFHNTNPDTISISITLWGKNWQNSHVFQLFSQFSFLLSNVHHLAFEYSRFPDRIPTNVDWAHILIMFRALRTAYIYGGHTYLAPALESIDGEMAARLLPDLDLLFIMDLQVPSVQVGKFCVARQVSGHPVTLVKTYTEFRERQKSYA